MATTTGTDLRLRPVCPDDAALIVDHRERMFLESGRYPLEQLRPMSRVFADWLPPRLADGRYFGWALSIDGLCIASLGMMWLDWPPHPLHLRAGRGYLLNLYVERAQRRRGFARRLAEQALSHARSHHVDAVILHPTADAVPLYQSLGFVQSNEMIHLNAST